MYVLEDGWMTTATHVRNLNKRTNNLNLLINVQTIGATSGGTNREIMTYINWDQRYDVAAVFTYFHC